MTGLGSLVGLFISLLLILAMAWLASRWIASRGTGSLLGQKMLVGNDKFRVISQVAVGRGESVVLLRLQDKCYLLGVTASNVSLLTEITGEQAQEWIDESSATAASSGFRFVDVFAERLRKQQNSKK